MLTPGSQVLHYEIAAPLGSGGMGTVYRARDSRLGRDVAIKVLHAGDHATDEQRQRLLREARAASLLSSSNIASIFDIGEHDGRVFIVMELIEGEALSARLARGALPVREAVDVAAQVADALDEAHQRGIVHRDLKSANLMIDVRGRVKLLDFGLAKVTRPTAPFGDDDATVARTFETRAGTILGTFGYMAPEQVLAKATDARADLFALGVVLYEMLSGRLPFDGASAMEVIDRVLNAEPAPLSRTGQAVPPALDAIATKLLAKDPAFRYQSARDVYIDLLTVLRQLDSGVRPGAMVAASGFQAPSSGVGPAPSPVMHEPTHTHCSSVAVMTFANITRDAADDWIGSGIAETVTNDLKGIKCLTVVGRAQVFEAAKLLHPASDTVEQHQALDVGRRLGTTTVIVGGYQRLGAMLRITAQAVDVASGTVAHTVKVDGRVDEIFDLQDRIVFGLSKGLSLSLDDSAIEAIERPETRSVEAYEAFSRGMINLRVASRDGLDRAIAHFERALALDPDYAEAWVGLGTASNFKGVFIGIPDLVARGVEALQRAVTLQPRLAIAHAMLGTALANVRRHDDALAATREALRLDPGNAAGHAALARILWFGMGKLEEGATELQHAVLLNDQNGYAWLQLSHLHALLGRPDEAEHAARRAVDLQERAISGSEGMQIVGAHLRLGYALYRQGRLDEAIAEYESELRFLGASDHGLRDRTTIEALQKLATALWRRGERARADEYASRVVSLVELREAQGAIDGATAYYVAALHAVRGDAPAATRYLRQAVRLLDPLNRVRARLDPDFDPVRNEIDASGVLDGK